MNSLERLLVPNVASCSTSNETLYYSQDFKTFTSHICKLLKYLFDVYTAHYLAVLILIA